MEFTNKSTSFCLFSIFDISNFFSWSNQKRNCFLVNIGFSIDSFAIDISISFLRCPKSSNLSRVDFVLIPCSIAFNNKRSNTQINLKMLAFINIVTKRNITAVIFTFQSILFHTTTNFFCKLGSST